MPVTFCNFKLTLLVAIALGLASAYPVLAETESGDTPVSEATTNETAPAAEEAAPEATDQDEPAAPEEGEKTEKPSAMEGVVGLFEAREAEAIEVKFIAKSDRAARLLVTNKTDKPIKIQMPEAWVGVPILAQFGGGGGGGQFGGGGGGQSLGGGGGQFGGGGGGGQFGGGGAFSIPPDKTAKLDLACLCIEHGKKIPSSSNNYEIHPVEVKVDRPAVVELLKAFGRGELQHGAAQAAVWHLNNDLTWQDLAAKLTGTRRNINRSPYFNSFELRAAYAYAEEAHRRASDVKDSPITSPGYEDSAN